MMDKGTIWARKAASVAASAVLAVSLVPAPAFAAAAGKAAGGDLAAAVPLMVPDSPDAGQRYATGEILVEYDNARAAGGMSALSVGAMDRVLENKAGLDVVETVVPASKELGTVVKAAAPEGMGVEEAIAAAKAVPGVASAQPNYRYELVDGWDAEDVEAYHEEAAEAAGAAAAGGEGGNSAFAITGTNDKYLSKQYYLGEWEDEESHGASVIDAWEWARCDDSVTIAVLDTGCAFQHADLADRVITEYMWDAWAATSPGTLISGNNPVGDNAGHGTHVCGIAAATADNKIGVAGASYNARILPVKVFDDAANNPGAETATLVKAYQYVMKLVDEEKVEDLHVLNMSLGGYGTDDSQDDQMLKSEIERARNDYQILTVCAGGNGDSAGNPRTDEMYPSDWDACLSVTATNSYGENVHWSDYNRAKDISAPGYEIYSTYPGETEDDVSYFASLSGTSMASPLVAGCSALLWAAYPGLTVDEAVEAIQSTANKIDAKSTDWHSPSETGSPGVIDAQAAVQKVMEENAGEHRVRMKECQVTPIADQVFTGRLLTPQLDVTYADADGQTVSLKEGVDYRLDFESNREVGTAVVTVVGKGTYIGRIRAEFKIRYDMKIASITTDSTEPYGFMGQPVEPTIYALHNGQLLKEGVHYTVEYRDNAEPGEGRAVLTGLGDYMNDAEVTFEIQDKRPSLADAVVGAIATQNYTGKEVKPVPTVSLAGKKLVNGKDFRLAYLNNVDPGLAVVRVQGIGAYGGEKLAVFKIGASKSLSHAKVAVADAVFTGKAVKPKVTVKIAGTVLPASAYTVTYKNNTKVGTGTVTVRGKGSYSGTMKGTFKVNPKAPAAKAATGAGKKLTLSWAKQTAETSGFEVVVATDKNFTKGVKKAKVAGASKTSAAVGGLKAKTAYYAKVRAYKTVGSKTYWSAWSGVKGAKTK